ncbi:MAG: flippase, partial [Candidatus Krumholzibacteria bacterium]|nr:flippase [Candidatus Krumholzibacteria bacterium]
RDPTRWSYEDSSLERSFLWGLAITALPVASGFVVSWVVARWAGADTVGTVSWVMSYATAVLILGKFGLDLAASRLASEYGMTSPGKLRSLFVAALNLRLVFTLSVAVLSFVFAGSLAVFFNDPSLLYAIRVGALVVLCASLYEFNENFLVGLNRLAIVYKVRSIHLVSRITLTCLLVFLGFGATAILGGYCAAWVVAITVYAVLLRRHLPARGPAGSRQHNLRELVALSATLTVSSASVTIYSHMDRLMLGYFSGVGEVGQYAVARNTAELSLFPVFAMVMMLRPALAARFASDRIAESAHIIRNALRFSLISGVLFAAIFAALGVPLITFVFSQEFEPAGRLMLFFVGVILLRCAGAVILPSLIAARRERLYAYLTAASAGVNFLLNLVLIPRYQSRGAIVATIISYGILLVLGLRGVFARYGVRVTSSAISMALRTILAGALSGGLVWLISDQRAPSWRAFVWAGLLSAMYFVLIYALRVGSFSNVRNLVSKLRESKG